MTRPVVRTPAPIEPLETHVRLSVGWCLLAYVAGMLTVVSVIWWGAGQ
jgi:hypothetical protein